MNRVFLAFAVAMMSFSFVGCNSKDLYEAPSEFQMGLFI